MLSQFANPARFMRLSAWAMPLFAVFAAVLFVIGVPWALAFSPADYQQGETVRILYVHVPTAIWSMAIYAFMAIASLVGMVWRHVLADIAARAAAPIGAVFAGLCLVTGSIWGRPTWGTWWEWDGRLTSMLVLFITYLGYIALWNAIDDEERAARLAAILCLCGALNLPIVHFSVEWWSTLHQGSSLLRANGPSIDPSMLAPFLIMAGAFLCLFVTLTLTNMRSAILRRRVEAARLRSAGA
jgi:heme exporter protein C